jgi:formylglycine-generating enzyme required for sulfatase activity
MWVLALVLAAGGSAGEMVLLPAAEVKVQCSLRGKPARDRLPPPPRTVKVDGFWMDRTEVTVAAYRRCVTAGLCSEPAGPAEASNYHQAGREDHPVTVVSWEQADAYCRWAGKRLPTHAEWDRAAQGPTPTWHPYPWGPERPDCDRVARIDDSSQESQSQLCIGDRKKPRTLPVCSRPKGNSREGLCDLLGNTSEWVADWYVTRARLRPGDLSSRNPRGACAGQPTCPRSDRHMAKGGHAQYADLDSLDRHFCNAAWEAPPSFNGFRCALSSGRSVGGR